MSSSLPHDVGGAPRALPISAAFELADAGATVAAGERLARALRGGLTITLAGELGSGKTTLVRGILRGLGWTGPVKSPTYTLVEHYVFSSLYFYHFDFYRMGQPDEWELTGFAEYFGPSSVCVVEWPERAGHHLPPPDLAIQLAYPETGAAPGRQIAVTAYTDIGRACLSAMLPPGMGWTSA